MFQTGLRGPSFYLSLLSLFLGFLLLNLPIPRSGYASPSPETEVSQIPKSPSVPPFLVQRIPVDVPHCERYFIHKGQQLECDSNLGKDAERLKVLMHDVPAALQEIETYQENRDKVRIAAYVGTLGLIAAIVGTVVSRPAFDPTSGTPRTGGFIMLGGLGITANALIYGLSLDKTNEGHIGNAVKYFNAAHPDQPIQLQFRTEVDF